MNEFLLAFAWNPECLAHYAPATGGRWAVESVGKAEAKGRSRIFGKLT